MKEIKMRLKGLDKTNLVFRLTAFLNDYFYVRLNAVEWGSNDDVEVVKNNIPWIRLLIKKEIK